MNIYDLVFTINVRSSYRNQVIKEYLINQSEKYICPSYNGAVLFYDSAAIIYRFATRNSEM